MDLELFFDYACPYCYRGHQNLLALLPDHPDLHILWRPCESHPRPESYGPHSDLAIQGMYYLEEQGLDLMGYHLNVYQALFDQGLDISDIEVLARCAAGSGVDAGAFRQALKEGRYTQKVLDGNQDAWGAHHLDAVPSYVSGRHFIGSRDGVLVSREQLSRFLSGLASCPAS